MRSYLIIFLLLLTLGRLAFAQPLCEIKQFSLSENFFQNEVTDIIQDRKGLIWISGRNGLSQFDGYRFQNYKSYPGDGCLMVNNRINFIAENGKGNIWCRSKEGREYLFYVKTKRFIDVLRPFEVKMKKLYTVDNVFPLKKGVTWIVCKNACCFRVDDAVDMTGKGISMNGSTNQRVRSGTVYNVNQDAQGDEWVLTDKGVSIIGRKHFNSNGLFSYFLETTKFIWLASKNGRLLKYNSQTEKSEVIKLPSDVRRIFMLNKLDNVTLAIGTDAGLILINTENQSIRQINVKISQSSLNEVYSVFEDHIGDLWMSNKQSGILHFRKRDGKVFLLKSPENNFISHKEDNKIFVFEDKQGYVWTVPRGGNFCYFDRNEQILKYYYENNADPGTVISPSIGQKFLDRQGNLWIAHNQSFRKFSFLDRYYRVIPKEQDELEVRSFLLDRNKNLWVAYKDNKLKILDPQNKCIGYVSDKGTISSKPCLFNANVYSLLEDNIGNIWIGTKLKGLYLFERKTQGYDSFSVRHFLYNPADNFSLSDNNIYSLYQDSKQRIWVGTYGGGLNLVERKVDGNIRFIHNCNRVKKYPLGIAKFVRFITEVDGKVMLLGSTDGLISFNSSFSKPEEIQFFRNERKSDVASSLSDNDVMYMFTDSHHHTYILTESGGINEIVSGNLLSENIKFKNFSGREGLYTDVMLSMIEDRAGGLWTVSKQGLSKFDPSQTQINHFRSYTFCDNITFSESAIAFNALGNVVIGSDIGILEIDPSKIKEYKYIPSIVFTGLKINGGPAPEAIESLNVLELNSSQRDISIEFSALDYRNSKKIQYAYMLEGLDKSWHYVNQERSVSFFNLPHGKFRFLVKSTNSDGVWVNNVRSLSIEVKPTFWETGWPWLLIVCLLVIFALIIVYVLFTIFRLKNEVVLEHKLSNIKLNFFTDVSHELRTPLTLISSPIAEVIENEPLSDMAKEYLRIVKKNTDRMLRMVNQILDFRKIQYKKMRVLVEETDLVSFVSKIMDSFLLIAEEKKIAFRLDCNHDYLYLWIDKDKVEKIVFNLLSNAFKYTPVNKSVSVSIREQDEKAIISVIDDGVGIVAQKIEFLFQRFETLINQNVFHASSGLGLSLVKELVELHHGSIEVFSRPGIGSEFKIQFLKGKDHFKGDDQVDFIVSDEIHSEELRTTRWVDELNIKGKVFEEGEREVKEDKWSILIVEDNPELRWFLKNILLHEYFIIEAVNGQDGIEKASTLLPDMIVSDLMMPVMDGLDMVKVIKDNKDLCHIPVIMLSARSSLDDRITGLEIGIDDYITKPFSTAYLKTRIHNLINQRLSLQELYLSNLFVHDEHSMQKQLFPREMPISSLDEMFVKNLMDFMEKNMENASLSVEEFGNAFSMSRAVFFKKIKMLLGVSPGDFIRDIRIKRAVQLIESGMGHFTEVAYKCGFSDPNYFGKCFKKQTGVTPSEFKKRAEQRQ